MQDAIMNSEQGVGGGGGASIQRSFRMQDMPAQGTIMRERSFVRPQSHHQNFNHPHQVSKTRQSLLTDHKLFINMLPYIDL